MAWANKYLFKFKSIHGVEYSIYILQDGYSGSVIQRALGRAPILRKKKNGSICGTSLEIYAECSVDGEFTEFYTSDPKEYRVDLYRANTLIWSGFISPELYSEPSIAPPYDVQIVAVDGLGELKLHQFIPQGVTRVKSLLVWILEWTGKSRGIVAISSLGYTNGNAADFLDNVTINLDFMAGESCYNVLKTLLRSLHATITTYEDKWLIVRETDLSVSQDGTIAATAINTSGVVSSTTIASAKKTVGKMGVADAWPIQNLSTKIEPAMSKVTMLMPWHLVNFLDDPKFEKEPAQSAWVAPPLGTSVWVIRFPDFVEYKDESHEEITFEYDKPVYWLNNYPISDDRLYQQRQLVSFTTGFRLTISLCSLKQVSVIPNNLVVNISFTPTGGSPMYYLKDGWSSEEPSMNTQNQYLPMQHYSWEDYSVDVVPPYVEGPGTLKIEIRGLQVIIREATILMSPGNKGYKDTLVLNNGARGSGEDTELIGGRMLDGHVLRADCAQGIFLLNGAAITSYHDSRWSNADFLSITALGYAYSSALPRIRTEGKIDVPSGFSDLPLIVGTNVDSIIETYDWDLYNEEATISALSLPTGEITVEHETVEEITGTSGSADTGLGSGSSSGGGGGSYGDMFFELDLDHTFTSGKRAIKLKDEYEGLWSPGFMSSGGLSDDTGEEGVSLAAVWESLTGNTDDYANEKINAYHIPIGNGLSIDPATGLIEATVGASALEYLTDVQLTYPSAGQVLVYDSASSLWKNGTLNISQVSGLDNSLSIISGALQSLQSQIDSVASRENSEELLTSILCGYFDESGSAFSALRLTTVSKTAWGQTYWTSGGVPDNISGNMTNVGSITATGLIKTTNYIQATRFYLTDSIYFVADENGVKLEGAGFYTDSFSSAGGYSSGGGSGSIDAAAMWSYLTNTAGETTYDSVLINTAHIPDMSQIYHYVKSSDITDMATKTWVNQQSFATTARLDSDEAIISSALQSLQSQIDSVASRNCFDELSTTSLVTDAIAASNGYFNTIEGTLTGSLSGNATTASYLVSSSYGAGTGKNPIYFSGGRPVASSSSEGSAGLPVFLSGGYLTACTASSLFSSLSSSAATNLSVTVAGQNRTVTLYATYDSASENISSCFGTVSTALQSLQSQIDSVATRNMFDELNASAIVADVVAASSLYGSLTGNATTASYLVGTSYGVGSASLPVYFSGGLPVACTASSLFASLSSSAGANLSVTVAGQTRTATLYATYDSDGENISSCFGTISTAIRSLQSQIDSVAASRAFDELTVTAGYFDMLTVGANLNVDGHIYARGASVAGATASASDIKFKDDLEPILPNKAIDILMELKPTGWIWNDKSALEGKHSAGLIAQDVQKILPFAVMQIDDYMYLEYSVLHAYEIAGIQNHEQRISQLEAENRKLKEKIRVLEER